MSRAFRMLILGALCALLVVPGTAAAEVGIGPPVSAGVPLNSRLTGTLGTVVVTDDPTAMIDATITATVTGAGTRIAVLGPYLVHATGKPQRVPMALPADARAALARIERDTPGATGVVTYEVTIPGAAPGDPPFTFRERSSLILHAPAHPTHPTRLLATNGLFDGSPQLAAGTVWLPAPRVWPRTSNAGSRLATFGPVAVSAGCNANLFAQPLLRAGRDGDAVLAGVGVAGDTVRAGRGYRVRATTADAFAASITAAGLVRVAANRWAGLRIDALLDPECPPVAARTRSFIDALARVVRGATPHLRITRLQRR